MTMAMLVPEPEGEGPAAKARAHRVPSRRLTLVPDPRPDRPRLIPITVVSRAAVEDLVARALRDFAQSEA